MLLSRDPCRICPEPDECMHVRCCAPIHDERVIYYRSSSDRSERCLRRGNKPLAGKWFCYQHYPIWKTHYAILERIRAL